MPAADFAAAQARIAARRQQRLLEQQRGHRSNARTPLVASSNGSSGPEPSLRPTRQSPLDNLANTGLMVWDSIRGREGTKPAFRVGQVDAELLDEELLELLKGQVGEGMKYYGVGLPRANSLGRELMEIPDTSDDRLLGRNQPDSAGTSLQTDHMGPQCLLRRLITGPTLHRCAQHLVNQLVIFAASPTVAKGRLRDRHRIWAIRLDEMGVLSRRPRRRVRASSIVHPPPFRTYQSPIQYA